MNNIRKYIVDKLNCNHTYGYITKRHRINLGFDKSHVNDAFVIANGDNQERCRPFETKQIRRNSRRLQLNRKGFKPSIRKQRYKYPPNDKVLIDKKSYLVKGVHCKGTRIMVFDSVYKPKSISINKVQLYTYGKGISFYELYLNPTTILSEDYLGVIS